MATFTIKNVGQIRDDILRTMRNGLIQRGVANPQLGPGSHEYVLATAVANEFAVVGANTQIKADAQMPDTATGADLDRLATMYGLTRRVAGPSVGFVTLATSANTFVPAGQTLLDSVGLRYKVVTGGTYTNTSPGNQIQIIGQDAGTATNHAANDVLRWTAAPPYANPQALVSAGGLNGGVDAEGDEDLRARLISRMQNPPNNANWAQIAAIAEASSTVVQKAFVYPAANGPSTVHIAVAQAPQILTPSIIQLSSTSKRRDIDLAFGLSTGAVMSGTVVPTVLGQMPEYVETTITSVTCTTNNVAIGLSLPASTAAVPAGPGGGWIDGTPWPGNGSIITNTPAAANIVSVTSTSPMRFIVNAATATGLQANVTHLCFLDPTNWTLYRGKVIAVNATTPGAVDITIDTPWPNLAAGNYVWPDCANAQTYVNSILTSFGQMGPGEKVTATANLVRGYRHPLPALSWSYSLTATQLKALSNTGTEVLDTGWLYRQWPAAPSVPGSILAPPNIFIPLNIGFYPLS